MDLKVLDSLISFPKWRPRGVDKHVRSDQILSISCRYPHLHRAERQLFWFHVVIELLGNELPFPRITHHHHLLLLVLLLLLMSSTFRFGKSFHHIISISSLTSSAARYHNHHGTNYVLEEIWVLVLRGAETFLAPGFSKLLEQNNVIRLTTTQPKSIYISPLSDIFLTHQSFFADSFFPLSFIFSFFFLVS